MKILSLVLGLQLSFFVCFIPALSAQPSKADIEKIKSNPAYYWGEYTAQVAREAEEKALGALTRQIAVRIQANQSASTEEKNGRLTDNFSDIVKSYSAATLRNVQTLRLPPENGRFYILRYIEKSEVENIFEERRKLVGNMFDKAGEFFEDGNLEQAIKLCYHAMILIQSLPDTRLPWQGKELSIELPARINSYIKDISFAVLSDYKVSDKERELEVSVRRGSKQVKELSASFWDGQDQVNVRFVEGKAIIHLYGSSTQFTSLNLTINTQFYDSRQEIKEVAELWDFVEKPVINAQKTLDLKKSKPVTVAVVSEPESIQSAAPVPSATTATSAAKQLNEKPVSTAIARIPGQNWQVPAIKVEHPAFDTKAVPKVAEQINSLGLWLEAGKKRDSSDVFLHQKTQLIRKFNQVNFTVNQPGLSILPTWDAAEVRPMKAVNRYKRLKLDAPEVLVYDADNSGTVTDINFGVFPALYTEFADAARDDEDWKRRQVIVKFMERYRTGFLSRDADFVAKMFAEEAIVIVGRVLKPGEAKNPYQYVPEGKQQPSTEYVKLTKTEYIDRQRKLFKQNDDMFLGFSSFSIHRKNQQPGVYGISLRQNYQADTYADEGHLFLLVDFNGKEPQIYVRAWQPNEWSDDALIGLSNFTVLK